jgi:hypothetical protein
MVQGYFLEQLLMPISGVKIRQCPQFFDPGNHHLMADLWQFLKTNVHYIILPPLYGTILSQIFPT